MTNRQTVTTALRRLLLGVLLMPLCFSQAMSADVREVDHIVAIVDEDVIVQSELNAAIRKIVTQFRMQGKQLPPRDVVEKQVLDRLILNKLQMAAAERAGITAGPELVAQAVSNIARKNGLSIGEFRQALESEGISFNSFRQGIKEQITLQRLNDSEVTRRIRVTDQEVETYIAQQAQTGQGSTFHLRHILIATPEAASPEQLAVSREKAGRIVGELRSGADFQNMALTESDSRQALEGGDLGWLTSSQIPTIFMEHVTVMQPGEISDPIRSPSGFHIIQIVDRKGGERKIVVQTHAQHILINTNELTSDDDAVTRLQQLKQRIEGGDSFADLARSHSDDKTSAIKGGDLGWVTPGDLLPRFEEEMSRLAVNDLSEPFRTEFGWHLVQILGRRQHDSTTEVLKAEAQSAIRKRKAAEETELYLRRLRDEAYVDIRLGGQ